MKRWNIGHKITTPLILVLIGIFNVASYAQDNKGKDDRSLQLFRSLDSKVATLKQKALEINRDLILVEEESFIPAAAQLVVFFSIIKETPPQFKSIQIKLELDGDIVANHLYKPNDIDALFRSGKHRLYLGNLHVGKHTLVAHFTGKGKNNNNFKTKATANLDKAWTRKFIELTMTLPDKKDKIPEISVRDM